ncbi:NAD(P)-dependent oxidoreductase [Streptomyces sp. NPDC047082]|uniref:NAD-dependent epimerase/dehydratase family protein n=1 Tax=Streptomyces sp. NPDC047082 TaxID=3155259 RepID=UPI0033C56F2F
MVIGATGQIGRPAVDALVRDGWEVTAASRGGGRDGAWPDDVRTVRLDREDGAALAAVVGERCDLVVDVVAYGAQHARQLTALAGRVGAAVVVSSVSVYVDDRGRGFDTQSEPDGFPEYPLPLPETRPTVAPGEASYSTRKVALERELLAMGDRLPTTVLRPSAVHGPHSPLPRELYFVQRNLDGRGVRVLAHRGESRFHTSSARNIAELIRLAAARPASRVLNACDPQAPTAAEIGAAVDEVMGARTETILVDGPPPAPAVGGSPWSVPSPLVCDMAAAERVLGYRPAVSYARSLPETVEWLCGEATQDWRARFPLLARAYPDLFDYAAEDAWLRSR